MKESKICRENNSNEMYCKVKYYINQYVTDYCTVFIYGSLCFTEYHHLCPVLNRVLDLHAKSD